MLCSMYYYATRRYSDILKSKRNLGWRTCLIIPELDDELHVRKEHRDLAKQLLRRRQLQYDLDEYMDLLRQRERMGTEVSLLLVCMCILGLLLAFILAYMFLCSTDSYESYASYTIHHKHTHIHVQVKAQLQEAEKKAVELKEDIRVLSSEYDAKFNKMWYV